MGEPRQNFYRRKRVTFDDVLGPGDSSSDSETARPPSKECCRSTPRLPPTSSIPIEPPEAEPIVPALPDLDGDNAWGEHIRLPRYEAQEIHESESGSDNAVGDADSLTDDSEAISDAASDRGDDAVERSSVASSGPTIADSGSNNDSDSTEAGDDEDETAGWSVADATNYLYGLKTRHNISDRAFKGLWKGFLKVQPVIGFIPVGYLPSADTIKRHALRDTPELLLEVCHYDVERGEDVVQRKLKSFPKKRYEDTSRWKVVYEAWRAHLQNVVAFHRYVSTSEGQ